MFFFIFLIIINLLNSLDQSFPSSPPTKSPSKSPQKTTNNTFIFSSPLIHRSSRESPFFNRNYTRENHIENGVLTSLARARFFSQIKMKTTQENYILPAPVFGWNMLMKYSLGTPPVESYGIFDTGSSFTWIQCLPCIHCYNQGNYPFFDPKTSSSYRKVYCFDRECKMVPGNACGGSSEDDNDPGICLYYAAYLDSTTSRGIVSIETMTFSYENMASNSSKRVVFGCGNDNQDSGAGSPGIVGLGNLSSSLPHQLKVDHFSYYVSANGTHIDGVAHFGPGASMSDFGMTTPLLPNDHGLYYLNLTGISVDGSDLDFPSGIFEQSTDDEGNVMGFVIDSGSTYTMLRSEAFDVLKSAVMEAMYEHTPQSTKNFELCYGDVSGAPEVVFQFSGLDYILCDANLWVKRNGLYCMAIIRLKESVGKLSILGFHQQRNVQVGFDLEKNLLSLVYPGACPDDVVDFVP